MMTAILTHSVYTTYRHFMAPVAVSIVAGLCTMAMAISPAQNAVPTGCSACWDGLGTFKK
eukprot:4545245-Pleurochrysis_carterae.AAC.1